jgi:hypothetical protein
MIVRRAGELKPNDIERALSPARLCFRPRLSRSR